MTPAQPAAGAFDQRRLRDALGWFATGVTIITTVTPDGAPVGITANSFSSVSLDPPLVLFSLARRLRSFEIFSDAGVFAVSVLAGDQGALSNRFASSGAERWQGVSFTRGHANLPVIAGALASFECTTEAIHDGGDHIVMIGRVRRFHSADDGEPLLFCRGAYRLLEPQPAGGQVAVAAGSHLQPPLTGFDPWVGG